MCPLPNDRAVKQPINMTNKFVVSIQLNFTHRRLELIFSKLHFISQDDGALNIIIIFYRLAAPDLK